MLFDVPHRSESTPVNESIVQSFVCSQLEQSKGSVYGNGKVKDEERMSSERSKAQDKWQRTRNRARDLTLEQIILL